MKTNLIPAPRATFHPEFSHAARLICRETGNESPDAFTLAYRVYSETFAATLICPASAAFDAAKRAVRLSNPARIVLLYAIDGEGQTVTPVQRIPADRAECLQIARNRAEMSCPAHSLSRPNLRYCDSGYRWVTEETE